ncbi:MAG: hypothetical protein J1E32_06785 [Treponema sp.]|nr:hypothetical protein [Treponema sp.]
MNRKYNQCVNMLRQLVSDVQGAPYPGNDFNMELYQIWYEHIQRAAVETLGWLDENAPEEKTDFSKTLKQFFN